MNLPVFRLFFILLAGVACSFVWFTVGTSVALVDSHPAASKDDHLNLQSQLSFRGLESGLPMFIRVFKEESVLEVWMRKDGNWVHFRDFEICKWSGQLGPKLKEGDKQSPEGFYAVSQEALNPNSSYHLSFNLGFPNNYDQANGRTGSFLMVHGKCVSIGCYAMTDPGIEIIYGLVEAALKQGQKEVPVHVFPFRMSDENMQRHAASPWVSFWNDLRPAWSAFNKTRRLPVIEVENQRYVVRETLGRLSGG